MSTTFLDQPRVTQRIRDHVTLPSGLQKPGREWAGLRFHSVPWLERHTAAALKEIVNYCGSIAPGIGRTSGTPLSEVSTA